MELKLYPAAKYVSDCRRFKLYLMELKPCRTMTESVRYICFKLYLMELKLVISQT